MSTIDSSNSLNTILDKLGIQKPAKETGASDKLGQADFLKLMTTQLQNQDPFAPMENAEFIAQMAQFSTVTGITEISESLKGMSDQLSEFRIATAANMLGHSVLVPGSIAYPDADGTISTEEIKGLFAKLAGTDVDSIPDDHPGEPSRRTHHPPIGPGAARASTLWLPYTTP